MNVSAGKLLPLLQVEETGGGVPMQLVEGQAVRMDWAKRKRKAEVVSSCLSPFLSYLTYTASASKSCSSFNPVNPDPPVSHF
jgi:hypothetical protein